jgi:hypothetical protein
VPVKTRIAAKPAADGADDAPPEEAIAGDPRLDQVLAAAIRAAKSRSQATQ